MSPAAAGASASASRALAMAPEWLIADEPVSALDVSEQALVLEFLAEIRGRLGLTSLFITHDLRVPAQVCHRIAVIQRGAIVEPGPTDRVFGTPQHAYTWQLPAASPGGTGLRRHLCEVT